MQIDLREQLQGSFRNVALAVGADMWRLYVYGVTRVGPELFIQTALFGPRTCTAVVRITTGDTPGHAAGQALHLIRDWLASGDKRRHVFLEPPDSVLATC